MLSPSLPSLSDLCGIRFAYLIWTRHNVTTQLAKEELFYDLADTVLDNVRNYPLPESVKSRILQHVKPAGQHLLCLLNSWLPKPLPKDSQKWLTGDMLFESLILNGDGLINRRKTAEKLLSDRMLPDVPAFRLACMNFLEKEVLKLWPLVKLHFLNKIVLESEQPFDVKGNISLSEQNEMVKDFQHYSSYCSKTFREIHYMLQGKNYLPTFPCSKEPYEILYWISYCISIESGTNLKDLPHFTRTLLAWDKFSVEDAAISGNVPCFEYLRSEKIEYSPLKVIATIFALEEEAYQQSSFIFHLSQLNSEEKTELFRRYPMEMTSQFLQWPLSLTFVENTEELWNLIPDEKKYWVFSKIVATLYPWYFRLLPIGDAVSTYKVISYNRCWKITGMYSIAHLKSIWVALWKIVLKSDKTFILNKFIFSSILSEIPSETAREILENSDLKVKLFDLFVANGEIVLELYDTENMKESIRNLVIKYMPQDFELLERYISFLEPEPPEYMNIRGPDLKDLHKHCTNPVNKDFVSFMKNFLFSTNSIDKAFIRY